MNAPKVSLLLIGLALSALTAQSSYAYKDHHVNVSDIFKEFYLNWASGNDDEGDRLDEFLNSQSRFASTTVGNTPQKYSFQDINGDGLPDFLYHERNALSSRRFLALFLNSGDLNFTLVYRCAILDRTYYGDCAEGVNLEPEDDMINEVSYLMGFFYDNDDGLPPASPVMLDLNGDGLLDLFQHSDSTAVLYINDGSLNFNRHTK